MAADDWPDWRGQHCAIVASGPSTKKAGVEQLRGRLPVIAIKENVDLCPWAEVAYGCDKAWWVNRNGLPEFKGLKVSFEARFPDVRNVIVEPKIDRILTDPGVIGSGGNSGFQAVNLAVQWGALGILLIGFDLQDRGGTHWYGRATGPGRNNPGEFNFRRWRAAFMHEAPKLQAMGIEVVNASPVSAINCFPKLTIPQALERWAR